MKKTKHITNAAMIAAGYAALSYLQNLLLPGSGTWAIQFRAAEALCVLAFFTPAAIPGLSVGCFLFNLCFASALAPDLLIGTAASALAACAMYILRNVRIKGFPLPGMLLPALCNGLFVGWELSVYVGGGFLLQAAYVAAGELAVLLTLGSALYGVIRRRGPDIQL